MRTMPNVKSAAARLAVATVLYQPDGEILNRLLGSIEESGLRLFIFVNGPIEAAVAARLALISDIALIRSPVNVGLGAGLNAVVAAAQDEGFSHILLFDQDSTPLPDLGSNLLDRFDRLAQSSPAPPAALGPALIAPEMEHYLPLWYSHRAAALGRGVTAVNFLPTSGTLLSLQAFADIGPFRADYFIDGIDVEWCFRAWSKGFACARADDLTMEHRWGHATGDDRNRPQILRQPKLRNYYYLRNAIYGLRLAHLPPRWRLCSIVRLTLQSGLLIIDEGFSTPVRGLLWRALSDGLGGRLGPAPATFDSRK